MSAGRFIDGVRRKRSGCSKISRLRVALQSLEELSGAQLPAYATATLPHKDYARLNVLRERRDDGIITPVEQAELDRLTQAADTQTLQKAYAAVLLK